MKDIFALYKPTGMTSHDIVNIVRRKTGVKRVGHGGTLDPLAEGVLIIAVGRENTKQLDQYVKGEKEYVATLTLGFVSDTDDREGPLHEYESPLKQSGNSNTISAPTRDAVLTCIKKFIGQISQTPPVYSAIKIRGKPAYKRTRKGETLTLEPRIVTIHSIEVIRYEYPELEIRVACGSGTYIRSLARDIGYELNTGAYLSRLIRTKVGEFDVKHAISLEEFIEKKE